MGTQPRTSKEAERISEVRFVIHVAEAYLVACPAKVIPDAGVETLILGAVKDLLGGINEAC